TTGRSSRIAMEAISVWNGRLCGANAAGCAGSRLKCRPRFCSTTPVPSATTPEPKLLKTLWITLIRLPWLSATHKTGRIALGVAKGVRLRLAGIEVAASALSVGLREERRHRHPCVGGIADPAVAVGVRELRDLDEEMEVLDGGQRESG